jgi:hypothetical protein
MDPVDLPVLPPLEPMLAKAQSKVAPEANYAKREFGATGDGNPAGVM